MRMFEDARGELSRATELARERPFGPLAVTQNAAKHFRARRRPRDLLNLGFAIDGKKAHAKLKGALDVALLLDRIAITDAVRARARRQRLFDFDDRGGV